MKRVSTLGIIAAAAFFCAAPLSLQWSPAKSPSLALDTANARIGHPGTAMSVAGVHRRAMRRTYGVGANLGRHPVARAAAVGAVAAGAGYGGWGGGWVVGAAVGAVGAGIINLSTRAQPSVRAASVWAALVSVWALLSATRRLTIRQAGTNSARVLALRLGPAPTAQLSDWR